MKGNNKATITLSIEEYELIKKSIQEHENVEVKLNNRIENLKERLALCNDAFHYIQQTSPFQRIFNWREIIKDAKNIAKGGINIKKH